MNKIKDLIFKYIEDNGLSGTIGIHKNFLLKSGIKEDELEKFLNENKIQVDGDIIIVDENKLKN